MLSLCGLLLVAAFASCSLAGDPVVYNVSELDACCKACKGDAGCTIAIWEPSAATCFLKGEYAFTPSKETSEYHLACLNPAPGVQNTCACSSSRDYHSVHAATLKNVPDAEACCAACTAWGACKVGLWHARWHDCYLKAGFVTPVPVHDHQPPNNKDLTSCLARTNSRPAHVFDCTRPGAQCQGRLGVSHWGPCYSVNASLPSLLDGATSIRAIGSRVIKVALFSPSRNYPLNSPSWSKENVLTTPEVWAKHPYYRSLWDMDFETYVLVVYSTAGGLAGDTIKTDYWVEGVTAQQLREEEEQFRKVTAFLLSEYPDKTFVLQNTEGDWASRGGLRVGSVATSGTFKSLGLWLQARQAGVTKARTEFRKAGAMGNVYLAAEVNLVLESLRAAVPCVVDQVLPHVPLDMVSYSSYDSQQVLPDFEAAMAFVLKHHNRTIASPPGPRALLIGEFGLPQNAMAEGDVQRVVSDVVNSALAFGVSFLLFWQVYCNECFPAGQGGCSQDGRCRDAAQPVQQTERLRGFWLVRPNGTFSWSRTYIAAKVAGQPEVRPRVAVETLMEVASQPHGIFAPWVASTGAAVLLFIGLLASCRVVRQKKDYAPVPVRDISGVTLGAVEDSEEEIFSIN